MNRLQNAQKLLAESLEALESAVDRAQNFAAIGDGTATAPVEMSTAIDINALTQELSAIEADLETAMKMIADLTETGVSSGASKGGTKGRS